jgi:ABC-type dipeptide/oligopeptide/nickel transport system permease subunit
MDGIRPEQSPAQEALKQAAAALQRDDKFEARRLAMRAAMLNPRIETPWLILAAVVQPELSVSYLNKALAINPGSERARNGLHWAINRLRHQPPKPAKPEAEAAAGTDESEKQTSLLAVLGRRILSSALILLAVTFLTLLGFYLAQQGRAALQVNPLTAILHSISELFSYIFQHPKTYLWHKVDQPAFGLVFKLFQRSAALLLLSLLVATTIGGWLGIAAARLRRRNIAPIMIFTSILGVSLPSFLVAMLLWVLDFRLYRWLGTSGAPLPPTGFGWDLHLVMPVVVLAARPLAQIMQVTYINMKDVFTEDYMRVAKAKGGSRQHLLWGHGIRNIFIPVLTTMSTSLRFSLSSLPVVESFFLWPGIGLTILEAIKQDMPMLVTDLILSLGLFFLVINILVEFFYPLIDARLRKDARVDMEEQTAVSSPWLVMREMVGDFWESLREVFKRKEKAKPAWEDDTAPIGLKSAALETPAESKDGFSWRTVFANPSFVLGSLLVLAFIGMILFGPSLTDASPYQTHSIELIEGEIQSPPFSPSETFPWGTDVIGRDMKALVLAGARQTLTLAFVATIARLLLGTILGIVAGWLQDSWVDRLINAIISVWAAFPETIFAMLFILALGIQKGRSVFIITLCVVGWGQIAQFVRSQVISQKPELYIEAARSVGARALQILVRHTIPYLVPSLLVTFALEMGGVLMLLSELGFLNIFLGGGFKVMIGENSNMTPIIYYFSDVPEWGAMLANIRNWWRSYPWLAWSPGVFFFLSIFTFNLWGEGLRRFLRESRINLNKVVNRYTMSAAAVIVLGIMWVMRSTTPMDMYKSQAAQFNAENVLADIEVLASEEFRGRESGKSGATDAAEYIAERMAEIGLMPGVNSKDYLQEYPAVWAHLTGIPKLQIMNDSEPPVYRQDFTAYTDNIPFFGAFEGPIKGLVVSESSQKAEQGRWQSAARWEMRNGDLEAYAIVIREKDMQYINLPSARVGAFIVVAEDDSFLARRSLHPTLGFGYFADFPAVFVTSALGDKLLQTAGSSLDDLEKQARQLEPDAIAFTDEGVDVQVMVKGSDPMKDEEHYNVIGVLPGSGSETPMPGGGTLDNQVILISAYFDGLGVAPDGVFYPGANDNASGVAEMLEIARVLKEGEYFPEKTVIFVAWSGGQRHMGLSTDSILGNTNGLGLLHLEAIFELSGVGAGSGKEILLDQGSSFRLVDLFEDAARRMGNKVTSRGRGPHFGQKTGISFGGRESLTAYISWDGSDQYTGMPLDTLDKIDVEKLQELGETTTLVVTLISREVEY